MLIAASELNYIMGCQGINKHAKIVVNRAVNKRLRIATRKPTHITSLGRMFAKGRICEDESIAVFNELFGKRLVKNTKVCENGYIKGICDLIDGDTIIDIKTAWTPHSHPKSYKWQLHGYMWLYDKPKACTATVFVDTPEHLLIDEDRSLHKVTLPLHERVKLSNFVERDEDIICQIREKCEQLNSYFYELLEKKRMTKDYSLNALNGHIHDQISVLMNPDLSNEELDKECKRAKALAELSAQSLGVAQTYIKAADIWDLQTKPKLIGG